MRKILVVEDDKDVRDCLVDFLAYETKANIVTANNQGEAIAAFDLHQPGFVFIDVSLDGGMNSKAAGLALLEIFKKKEPSIVVVMMSGLNDKDTIKQAKELGAADYLEKPYRPDLLREKILPMIDKACGIK